MGTKYKDVKNNPNYPEIEKAILNFWKNNKIFDKVNSRKKDRKEKVYLDGPITANNLPHYGHFIQWTLKDVVPRYWTMTGFYVSRNIGWDCQGIPVEYEIEKKKGFTHKKDIEDFGIIEFNKLCRESVLKYQEAMWNFESRAGRWMDKNDMYFTMDADYIESSWWSLKEFYKKDLMYEGHKVVPYSTRAGSTLSNFEVALGGYKEVVDPAVTVKFKLNYHKTGIGVGVVIRNEKGEILISKRKAEGREDTYGIIGGSLDPKDKNPLDNATRECIEEIGVVPEEMKVVGSSVDIFEGRLYHTHHVSAKLDRKINLKKCEDEFSELKWVKESELPWDYMHIPTRNVLQDVLGLREFKKHERDKPNVFALAWTTTPWTLPGNLMLSVGRKYKYVLVESNGEYYVLAKDCLEDLFKDKESRILDEFGAKELVGLSYTPLYDNFIDRKDHGAFKFILADHVNTEEGTGVVHLAPYGMEDFDLFMKMNMPLFDYLDDTAHFTDLVPGYKGLFYKKANKRIIEDLQKQSLLLKHEDYPHQMPMCWRTNTPLIYKPIKSWYIAVTKYKDALLRENNNVKWVPDHVRTGRFGKWLENARDWALSRNRYWGTPLPIWVNDKTGEKVVLGSFKELEEKVGKKLPDNFDPHKPFIDEYTWKGNEGGTFRRVPDVIDVWYDSGVAPFAQYHYPFENKEEFERKFPVEYISESVEMCRGWFYSLMLVNVGIFDKSPFKSVVAHGMLGAEDGKKLSKSLGNYPPMEEELDLYGADIFRYLILTSPVVRGETGRFSYKFLDEAKKEFFTTLWNSYRYFVTYANLYGFKPESLDYKKLSSVLDRWVLYRLNEVVKNVRENMDNYEIMYAVRNLTPFVSDLSTWYIRRSRDRLSTGDKTALNVLHHCLLELSKLIAPFMPFVSEEIYANLVSLSDKKQDSVHLEDYPAADSVFFDDSGNKGLIKDMRVIREVCSVGNAIRKEKEIPVKQPLMNLYLGGVWQMDEELKQLIKDELNVKKVSYNEKGDVTNGNFAKRELSGDVVKNGKVYLDLRITDELKVERYARELLREIQKLRKSENVAWDAKIKVQYNETEDFKKAMSNSKFVEEIKRKSLVTELIAGDSFKIL